MSQWATVIARTEHACPRCGAAKGDPCHTPQGRRKGSPHGERIHLLSRDDWNRCTGKVQSFLDLTARTIKNVPAHVRADKGGS